MTGDGKELTMQYSNVAVNGEFPVYFVAVPKEGHTLTVVVETSRGEKKYSYTYEDMVNKRIHESDKKVTVNKTLRRMYKIRHGVYVLYIPKTEKTYICKIK